MNSLYIVLVASALTAVSAQLCEPLEWTSCMALSFERRMNFNPWDGTLRAVGYTEQTRAPFNSTSLGQDMDSDDWYSLHPHEAATLEIEQYPDVGDVGPIFLGQNVTLRLIEPTTPQRLLGNETFDELMTYFNNGGTGMLLKLKNNSTLTVAARGRDNSTRSYTAGPDPNNDRYIAVGFKTGLNVTVSVPQANGVNIIIVWDGPYDGPNEWGDFRYPEIAKPVIKFPSLFGLHGRVSSDGRGCVLKNMEMLSPINSPEYCLGVEMDLSVAEELLTYRPTATPTGSPTTTASGAERAGVQLAVFLAIAAAIFGLLYDH